jgi:hypothetical protein
MKTGRICPKTKNNIKTPIIDKKYYEYQIAFPEMRKVFYFLPLFP